MVLSNIYKKINHKKTIILLVMVFFFTFIYLFLDDSNFSGINNIREIIKKEIIKEKIKKEIKENFKDIEKDEQIIDRITKETKNIVKKKEFTKEKIKPNIYQNFFDRLYFSAITSSTLGYGDIYPVSNIAKMFVLIQAISTIIIIII